MTAIRLVLGYAYGPPLGEMDGDNDPGLESATPGPTTREDELEAIWLEGAKTTWITGSAAARSA
jgi:hypothetical protein